MTPRRTGAILLVAVAIVFGACSPRHAKTNPLLEGQPGTTTTAVARPAGFVALGDSLTSGGGATPLDVSVTCALSTKSWVSLLPTLDPSLHLIQNRACGGATTTQMQQPWPERGQPAQIPSTPDDSVGLVAFTVGANDLQAGVVITGCATTDCSRVTQGSTQYLANLTAHLAQDVYPAIHKAYPKARLVHVGYPLLTSEDLGDSCSWLSPSEVGVPNDVITLLDKAIKTAAEESGLVDYLDVRDAFAGHEMCTKDPWVYNLPDPAVLHPNDAGYVALAAAIDKGLRG
jgi:lysophospholipase L1-like esterase